MSSNNAHINMPAQNLITGSPLQGQIAINKWLDSMEQEMSQQEVAARALKELAILSGLEEAITEIIKSDRLIYQFEDTKPEGAMEALTLLMGSIQIIRIRIGKDVDSGKE